MTDVSNVKANNLLVCNKKAYKQHMYYCLVCIVNSNRKIYS